MWMKPSILLIGMISEFKITIFVSTTQFSWSGKSGFINQFHFLDWSTTLPATCLLLRKAHPPLKSYTYTKHIKSIVTTRYTGVHFIQAECFGKTGWLVRPPLRNNCLLFFDICFQQYFVLPHEENFLQIILMIYFCKYLDEFFHWADYRLDLVCG